MHQFHCGRIQCQQSFCLQSMKTCYPCSVCSRRTCGGKGTILRDSSPDCPLHLCRPKYSLQILRNIQNSISHLRTAKFRCRHTQWKESDREANLKPECWMKGWSAGWPGWINSILRFQNMLYWRLWSLWAVILSMIDRMRNTHTLLLIIVSIRLQNMNSSKCLRLKNKYILGNTASNL